MAGGRCLPERRAGTAGAFGRRAASGPLRSAVGRAGPWTARSKRGTLGNRERDPRLPGAGGFWPAICGVGARSTGATTAARRSSAASMRRRARRSSRRNCIARTRALRKATDNVRDLENHSGFQHPRQMGVPVQQQSVGRQAQLRIGPSSAREPEKIGQPRPDVRDRRSDVGPPPHAAAFPKAEGRRAPEALNRTQRIPDSVTHIRQTSCGAIANRRVNGLPISSVLKGRETAIEQQVGRDLPKVVLGQSGHSARRSEPRANDIGRNPPQVGGHGSYFLQEDLSTRSVNINV